MRRGTSTGLAISAVVVAEVVLGVLLIATGGGKDTVNPYRVARGSRSRHRAR